MSGDISLRGEDTGRLDKQELTNDRGPCGGGASLMDGVWQKQQLLTGAVREAGWGPGARGPRLHSTPLHRAPCTISHNLPERETGWEPRRVRHRPLQTPCNANDKRPADVPLMTKLYFINTLQKHLPGQNDHTVYMQELTLS